MSENVIQSSFSAGELSPNLFARVDFAKYKSGCATLRNFFVDYRSGASTRTGTEYIRPAGSKRIRLVRFQQSTTVTYILEFGGEFLRFISQGASVVEGAIDITFISQSSSADVSITDTSNYQTGNLVFISGVVGMNQINNRYYIIDIRSGIAIGLQDPITGETVNSLNFDPYNGGGTVQRVYTIPTPYNEDELSQLKFSQNASVMNITHPNHQPYVLTLIDATNWTLVPAVIGASVLPPVSIDVTTSAPGAVTYKYVVTSVDAKNQESPPSPVGSVGSVDLRLDPGTNHVVWAVMDAQFYNVYGSSPSYVGLGGGVNGVGFMGSATGNEFFDSNISPDFAQVPPIHDDPFGGGGGIHPACSSYFQQRLVYANGGGNLVATFWASRTGAPYNFDVSNPTQANDAITAELVSLEVNEIKSLIPMSTGLIALTTSGVWQINGGAGGVATQGGPITPTTVTATPQAYIGANDVPPIVVNYDIIFVQSKGSIVRDLTFNIYSNIYTGNDISILSSHMFYGHQIKEWAYAEEPFKIIWVVRDDGILLGLTLVKEQEMYGWSRHDTLGNFMSVATVTEGTADATYFAIERPSPTGIGTITQIERLANREFPFGAEDAWCVDNGLKTVSNLPDASLTVSGVTGDIELSTDVGLFTEDHVGWVVRAGGGIVKITSFVSETLVTGTVVQPITNIFPDDPQNRPNISTPGTWALDKPTTKLFGLDHMEGQKVVVLADGGVINDLVVFQGSITLPIPVTKAIVGYSYQAQLQTMPLDLGNEINSVQGKRKKIAALTLRVKDSRGAKAGRTFETVTPIKELNRVTQLGFPVKLVTADERIVMDPLWDVPGQICVQVDDPLPVTLLGVIPEVAIGDTSK